MDADQRRREILIAARTDGSVEVTRLASELGISRETVRRDLRLLASQGLLRRTHGGAYPVESAGFEASHAARATRHLREKARIAETAVSLLREAESVFIDEGYTPQLVAEALPHSRPYTVITTSLATAAALSSRPNVTILQLGGRVRGSTLTVVGEDAIQKLSDLVTDVAFISANGVSREFGLTTPDPAVAAVKHCAVKHARRRILTGISPKFGAVSFSRFAEIGEFDTIVTDAGLPVSEAQRYARLGPQVLRA
ncbi:DeoR/GlpR family DNA-binding transcription regulator [Streptomyces sp. NPDC001514]